MGHDIFAGKGAEYKEQILKVLYEKGYLTSWEIAKERALLICKPFENLANKTRNVYSKLVGKKGRLLALVNTQFIEEVNTQIRGKDTKGYQLTFKGVCIAAILFKEREKPRLASRYFSELVLAYPEFIEKVQQISNDDPKQDIYAQIRQVTHRMLDTGVVFEKLSNAEFTQDFFSKHETLWSEYVGFSVLELEFVRSFLENKNRMLGKTNAITANDAREALKELRSWRDECLKNVEFPQMSITDQLPIDYEEAKNKFTKYVRDNEPDVESQEFLISFFKSQCEYAQKFEKNLTLKRQMWKK